MEPKKSKKKLKIKKQMVTGEIRAEIEKLKNERNGWK